MSTATELLQVTDRNIAEILEAERAALIITRTDCGHCAAYQQDILARMERGAFEGLVIGKLVLDAPGAARFKKDNPWVAKLDSLPYTVLYRKGERVDEFAASKGLYLMERVEDVLDAA